MKRGVNVIIANDQNKVLVISGQYSIYEIEQIEQINRLRIGS